MGTAENFLSCDREPVMLLAPSVADRLPVGHLAGLVIEVVGQGRDAGMVRVGVSRSI